MSGTCDPAFAAVRAAFEANLAERGEHGAALCVMHDGRVVVDLVGGIADGDPDRPWTHDTLVNAFSVGKAMVATLTARLAGDGVLDLDAPVAEVWPEFSTAGKQHVTTRHLLSHQAGLPAVRRRLPPGTMLDHDAMAAALAAQEPWWEPGTAHGYHTNTFGFLVGEVLARVAGRSTGTLLRELIAEPLGADVHLGLPASEHHRVADFGWPGDAPPEEEPTDLDGKALDEMALMRHNTYWNPSGLSGAGVLNTAAWRAAELPSTNLHASARGIARVFAALAAGGEIDGVRIVGADALRAATTEQVYGDDVVLERPTRFGLGFQLTQPERPMGPNPGAFGHYGAAGSLGCADPEAGLALGYVTDRIGARWQNPRNRALLDALHAAR